MRYLINDYGRECTCCGAFKDWCEYSRHNKGTRGRKSRCQKCVNMINSIDNNNYSLEASDSTHKDAHKIIDRYNNIKYNERLKVLRLVLGRAGSRYCQLCDKLKSIDDFSVYKMNNKHSSGRAKTCYDCKSTKRDRIQSSKVLSKKKKITEALNLSGSNYDIDNGFVYMYRCDELDCFKIGKTKSNPFDYISTKSKDYGLKLSMVAYIASPIRDYDAEWLATKTLKDKRVKHTKPCGGEARELFNCGLHEALNILKSISDRIYIEPNPYVNLSDLQG